MTIALILNAIFSFTVFSAIVGLLGWAIAAGRRDRPVGADEQHSPLPERPSRALVASVASTPIASSVTSAL